MPVDQVYAGFPSPVTLDRQPAHYITEEGGSEGRREKGVRESFRGNENGGIGIAVSNPFIERSKGRFHWAILREEVDEAFGAIRRKFHRVKFVP
jgi:hypothetical protein